jgi:hypothetical protein
MSDQPVTWLKAKYRRSDRTDGHTSKHNDGTRRRASPRRKLNDQAKVAQHANQPIVTLVLLANGKRRFVKEPRRTENYV